MGGEMSLENEYALIRRALVDAVNYSQTWDDITKCAMALLHVGAKYRSLHDESDYLSGKTMLGAMPTTQKERDDGR